MARCSGGGIYPDAIGTPPWRRKHRLIQIGIQLLTSDLRLRRLLCGKATPFRWREHLPTPSASLRQASGAGGEDKEEKVAMWAGKAEPFRTAVGGAPLSTA